MKTYIWILLISLLALSLSCGQAKKRRASDDTSSSDEKGDEDKSTSVTALGEMPATSLIPIMGKSKKSGKDISFGYDPQAELSKDGKTLVLRRKVKGSETMFYISLFDLETKAYKEVSDKVQDITEPSISPDSKKIAFIYLKDLDKNGGDVYLIGSDGQGLEQVTKTKEPESNVSFSNDGKSLCFIRDKKQLIIYDIAGKKETIFDVNSPDGGKPSNINHPSFALDDKALCFDFPKKFNDKVSSKVIGVFTTSDKKTGYATIDKGDQICPVWIKDGSYIAYIFTDATTKDDEGKEVTTNVIKWASRGGEKTDLLVKPAGQVEIGERLSYSPTKNWLCFSVRAKGIFKVVVLPFEKPQS